MEPGEMQVVDPQLVILICVTAAFITSAVFGWILRRVLKAGVMSWQSGDARRDQQPVLYWAGVLILVIASIVTPLWLILFSIFLYSKTLTGCVLPQP